MNNQPSSDDDWEKRLREKTQLVQRIGRSTDGKKLMELLTEVFEERVLMHPDPYQTYYQLGQRDVVQYLRNLMELKDE